MAVVAVRIARGVNVPRSPSVVPPMRSDNRSLDPAFGTQPKKRLIPKEVLEPLATKVLSGQLRDGETVVVDSDGRSLAFHASLTEAPLVA